MSSTVNFGIDLGTTNSLIAKCNQGNVEVFKNPNGFKETIPSIVGFRNDRILVGEQAKVYAEKDPNSVASRFKRKMGTTEKFKIGSINSSKTPIELSAFVLKELKNFVQSGEVIESAVITIPASFDTVQSNATKSAGENAGFKNVILLQEPIAASLAYANKEKSVDLSNSQWIVYDLGGGTFDVALVKILEGELTVVDHEGDNYLGGSDFDEQIVEKIIVPELNKRGQFANLLNQMKSEAGKYNKLWTVLLHKAEEAKIELSAKTSAEIDLGLIRDLTDDNGKSIDSIITITRSEYESVVKDSIDRTAGMMKVILTRNALQPSDLKFVLMVGGATYSPYVRKRIEEVMGIPVNTSIDPTNAIAVGAAYYAGTKIAAIKSPANDQNVKIKWKPAYSRSSQETEELFSAKFEGDINNLFYRITRDDGAFDSGTKALSARIVEDLPLRDGAFNIFNFRVYDAKNNLISQEFEPIQIAHGKYSVAGQMLPEDLCLVKDDLAKKDTRLERVFSKNSVLPAKGKLTVEVGKTIVKDSSDEIRIMVVEGSADNHSSTNKPIGVLVVSGKQIKRDLIKGTEIDLTFEMSESRDLTVSAYLNGTGQEFSQVFDPKPRAVPVKMLASEILALEEKIQNEQAEAEKNSNHEVAEKLEKLTGDVQSLITSAASMAEDDVTDDRFKLEDKKRKLAQEMFLVTAGKRTELAKAAYMEAKQEAAEMLQKHGNDRERHHMNEIFAREKALLSSTNPERIHAAANDLRMITFQILSRAPEFLVAMFLNLVEQHPSMNDAVQARQLIENGKRLMEKEEWEDLKIVNARLWQLMPEKVQASEEMRMYTGIV